MNFEDFDIGKILAWIIENFIFFVGSVLLFAKTSDLMTAFAPHSFMGYTGIESIYGFVAACLVEGVFVLTKILVSRSPNALAWMWNIVLIVVTFAISALAQTIDSFVVRDTLSSQPSEIQLLVQWGVPMIPSLVVAIILVKTVIDSLPREVVAQFSKGGKGQNKTQQNQVNQIRPQVQSQFIRPQQAQARPNGNHQLSKKKDKTGPIIVSTPKREIALGDDDEEGDDLGP